MLSLSLSADGDETLLAEGRVLDLRKGGVVAMGGLVNGPGVVHDMRARLVVAREGLRIREATLSMPSVPFSNGRATAGETCRDNENRFGAVVGLALGPGFLTSLQRAIGGPRGCFHVFTVLRLLGPSLVWALNHGGIARRGGRAFVRTIVVDGFADGSGLRLRGTLADLRYDDAEAEHVADAFEAEVDTEIALPALTVTAVSARQRRASSAWAADGLDGLRDVVGHSLLRGYSLKVNEAIPSSGRLAPVRELALMLQPVAWQCMPTLAERRTDPGPGRRGGPMAAVDSCSMWRAGGPLVAELERQGDVGPH